MPYGGLLGPTFGAEVIKWTLFSVLSYTFEEMGPLDLRKVPFSAPFEQKCEHFAGPWLLRATFSVSRIPE